MELWSFLNVEDNGKKWWLHFSINSWWKTELKKDTDTPIFIATLFMIGRTWMQPRKKPTGRWTDKGIAVHIHYGILLFSRSVPQSFPTPYNPMDCSTSGFPVHHDLPEFVQTHVHWVGDAIQPSHPLSSPSPPTFKPSQHQGLFQWVGFSCQVAKVLELQLQHQSFQGIFRTDFHYNWQV